MTKSTSHSLTQYFVIGIAALGGGIAALSSFAAQRPAERQRGEAVASGVEWLTLGLGIVLIPMGIAMLVWSYVLYRRGQADHTSDRSSETSAAQAPPTEAAQVRPALGRPTESPASQD